METKIFEIRDKAAFIPMIAIWLNPTNEADRYVLARAGYGRRPDQQRHYVLLGRIAGGEDLRFNCEPEIWGGRTLPVAHAFIRDTWKLLESGQVIDVEFILGEKLEPKKSESETEPLV